MQTLPIDPYLDEIIKKIIADKPVILTASPGSGKTTRVPAHLLKQVQSTSSKKIIVIVPKRVSALSAADRIASENNWNLGDEVGYQVRFENKVTPKTQLIFMTEGLFLKRIQSPHFWNEIHTLIIDEFHERSCSIDLILGLSFEQKVLGRDLQIVIMSATLNVVQLKKFLGECESFEIEAPPHKLEIFYSEKNQKLICDDVFFIQLKETLLKAWKISCKDVLIFLPGQREILRFKSLIQPLFSQFRIEVLHGSLSLAEQKQIVRNGLNKSDRRIILSTNVAESSITVSGLDCVIDSGLEKKSYRESKVGFSGLDLQRISLFSAQQRAGRAAREQAGFCFKMWHVTDELSMKEQIEPEILKSSLFEESLLLYQQEVTDLESFSWLNKPSPAVLKQASLKLSKWQLLTDQLHLTALANTISKWPLSIENSILHYQLSRLGFEKESAKLIAVLESGNVETIIERNKNFAGSDVAKILDTHPLDFMSEQILRQILSSCKMNGTITVTENFEKTLIQVYAEHFPEKVAFVKNKTNAVSMFGRGLQVSSGSQAASSDFFIALAGRENHSQFTQVTCSLGFDKKLAQEIFAPLAKKQSEVHYDFEKNEFFKTEQLRFENFVLNDYGKTRLNASELQKNWKEFFNKSCLDFLKIHPSYDKIKTRLNFLNRKDGKGPFLSDLSQRQLNEFENLLTEYILEGYDDFEDYKNCDLFYLSYQVLNEELCDLLQNLPETIKSARGRIHPVDYSDEKAPLISLKIQDAFGWKDTPKICHDRFTLTLELLAPNMRPAQITSQLGLFWKTSYSDVRKELRARYPKHDWPEDPSL